VTIDGTTQTAFTGDTNPDGWEVIMLTEFFVAANNCRITGLNGTAVWVDGSNCVVEDNSNMSIHLYGGYGGSRFPNLADLILATDQDGNTGNFLANQQDYEFVRQLHERNRIIPVVGDFGGSKALSAVAGYLRRNGYTLSAFYTSNVEQYLFDSRSFQGFVVNVRQMPIDEKSLLIRSIRMRNSIHPGYVPGHRMSPLLVFLSVFLNDYDDGLYPDYWSVISTHYISGRED